MRAFLLLLLTTILPLSAWAVLGKAYDSVVADQGHMAAQLRSTAQIGFAVYEITSPYGERVREFATPAGVVFGVSWSGPVVPDLKQLLGDYFPEFQQGAQAAGARRRALSIESEHLVLQSAGHMRAFHGRAYIPALVPSGVSAEVVQ